MQLLGTRLQSGVHGSPPPIPDFKLPGIMIGGLDSPIPIPDSPGITGRGPPPSPLASPICRGSGVPPHPRSPICRGSGVHPHPHPRFAGDRGSIPIPGSHRGFRARGPGRNCNLNQLEGRPAHKPHGSNSTDGHWHLNSNTGYQPRVRAGRTPAGSREIERARECPTDHAPLPVSHWHGSLSGLLH